MKKTAYLLVFSCFVFLIVSGCGKKNTVSSAYRAVTQIDIVTKRDDTLIHRHYKNPEKLQYVLTFLRLLRPEGKPDINPEALTQDMFLIVLTRSDGSRVYYRQTGHRYFARDGQDWFCIRPEQAAKLYALLAALPGDDTGKIRKNAKVSPAL